MQKGNWFIESIIIGFLFLFFSFLLNIIFRNYHKYVGSQRHRCDATRVQGGAHSIRMGTFDYGLHLLKVKRNIEKNNFFQTPNRKRIVNRSSICLKGLDINFSDSSTRM